MGTPLYGLSMQGSPEMLPRFKTKVCSALHQFTCAGESVSKNKCLSFLPERPQLCTAVSNGFTPDLAEFEQS